MTLWLRARGAPVLGLTIVVTLLGLALPASAETASPSPAGATLAASCFLALAVPVAVGWGCARGDPRLEFVSTRSIRVADLALALIAVGVTSALALGMDQAGLAPAGAVGARAAAVYLSLMLLVQPWVGWRIATVVPGVYLLAVIMFGRGEDISQPAPWAWIAADASSMTSWVVTLTLTLTALLAYVVVPPRLVGMSGDD